MESQNREILPIRPRIIFMGTPYFAVASLKAAVEHGHNLLATVTQPDRPRGRGRKMSPSPVKRVAAQYGLEVLQPERVSDPEFCEVILGMAPDILIVVAFGQILNKGLLEIPRWGALNIHASLLPKYRGAAPIHWAILNDEAKTGLTAMRMDEGLDTGPILLQDEVPIGRDETSGELHDRLSVLSGDFLIRTLEGVAKNRLRERIQDHARATYAVKIDRRMSLVRWNQPAEVISALIRALDPWPGAFTTLNGREIKLFSSRIARQERPCLVPGRVAGYSEAALQVETAKGVLLIRELQISGKKRLAAGDFLKGFPLEIGTVLGS